MKEKILRRNPNYKYIREIYDDDEAVDFIECCLKRDPSERYSAKDLLEHPWMKKIDQEIQQRTVSKFINKEYQL